MEAGITGKQTITVTEEKTAQAMGSGTLRYLRHRQ